MNSMPDNERWEFLAELGSGGQGTVFRVRNKLGRLAAESQLQRAIWLLSTRQTVDQHAREEGIRHLTSSLTEILDSDHPSNHGALKVLNTGDDARDAELANVRIRKEIEALKALEHPNIAKIIESDPDDLWFVSKFYPNGGLDQNRNQFIGNVVESLSALRPIIEAAAYMHSRKIVHRDIKPNNIFVDAGGELILGDFGLVYFMDEEGARVSGTYENVGSWAWEPPWAQGKRIEEVRPSFDVFSLAKVLWYMVSGRQILPLWYYSKDENNVELIHPNSPHMSLLNDLLSKCVVEEEKHCLSNAATMLPIVDDTLRMITSGILPTKVNTSKSHRHCLVCGVGTYVQKIGWSTSNVKYSQYGLQPHRYSKFNVAVCDNCGHMQQFYVDHNDDVPPGWK